MSIRRLRLEHAILLERLEGQIVQTSANDEMMSTPPNPTLLDDSLNIKSVRNGASKSKKSKTYLLSNGSTKKAVRDPHLPKRPTNAYLMFCEKEKERIKIDVMANGSGKDISKVLTDSWKELDSEQKKPYQQLYEEDRERYKREMIEYNKRKVDLDSKEAGTSQKHSHSDELQSAQADDLNLPKRQRLEQQGDLTMLEPVDERISTQDSTEIGI